MSITPTPITSVINNVANNTNLSYLIITSSTETQIKPPQFNKKISKISYCRECEKQSLKTELFRSKYTNKLYCEYCIEIISEFYIK